MTLDNKTNSMFRKIGLFAASGLLIGNMACTNLKYERITSSDSDLKLLLRGDCKNVVVEYASGQKLYLERMKRLKDFKKLFAMKNYYVTKIKNPDGETFSIGTPYGERICQDAYDNLVRDLEKRETADDIEKIIAERAKIR